jgi:hypothetical protein
MQITLGSTRDTTVTPAEYVDSLYARHAIVGASGRPEAFRDYAAWVGTITASSEGGQATMAAGFVRIRPGQFLEILGQSKGSQGVDQIYQSIRSIAALRDADKLRVGPNVLAIAPARRTAEFTSVWSDFGNLAISAEDGAILNSTRGTTQIQGGTNLKIVKKGAG